MIGAAKNYHLTQLQLVKVTKAKTLAEILLTPWLPLYSSMLTFYFVKGNN
jgi:hypothetical protein